MDEIVYDAITKYYTILSKLGYYNYKDVYKLLLLCFYKDFTMSDYRGRISREDYYAIEKALYCLFGSNCLMPYPDYLKMGKLHLGEITELAQRVKSLESTNVAKVIHDLDSVENYDEWSDVIIEG